MVSMTVLLSEANHGSLVRVRPSEEVVLELEENPTTGYRWAIETRGRALKEIGSTYIPSSGSAIGGGGRRAVRFVAAQPGTAEIRAALRRPWEQKNRNADQYAVTITVEGEPNADDQ